MRGRHEVFGAGKNVRVGAVVSGNAFARFRRDARCGKLPSESEGSVAGAGAVLKLELGLESCACRGHRDGNAEVAGAGEDIRPEGFAQSGNRPAALRKRDLRHTTARA